MLLESTAILYDPVVPPSGHISKGTPSEFQVVFEAVT
jgi:hypothetical protein